MLLPPMYFSNIGLLDLILISLVEISAIWFFFPKEYLGKVLSMVSAVNLIKMGILSLIAPTLPALTSSLNQMLLLEVTGIFILGIIISTLMYEKEEWAQSREQAGALAFRISAISSLIWVTHKSLQPPVYYYSLSTGFLLSRAIPESVSLPLIPALDIYLNFLGIVFLAIGALLLILRYKKHFFVQRAEHTPEIR
ncbi:MAG: hypothetical protein ACFFFG_07430 [Candidatus Thorarchaeota archaeon]